MVYCLENVIQLVFPKIQASYNQLAWNSYVVSSLRTPVFSLCHAWAKSFTGHSFNMYQSFCSSVLFSFWLFFFEEIHALRKSSRVVDRYKQWFQMLHRSMGELPFIFFFTINCVFIYIFNKLKLLTTKRQWMREVRISKSIWFNHHTLYAHIK